MIKLKITHVLFLVVAIVTSSYGQQDLSASLAVAYELESTDPDSAISKYKSLIHIARAVDSAYIEAEATFSIGIVYMNAGSFDSSYSYLLSAYGQFDTVQDKLGQGKSLVALGNINNFTGNQRRALESYQKALLIYEELSDVYNQVRINNNIGALFNTSGDYLKAIEVLERAAELGQSLELSSLNGDNYNNRSLAYQSIDSFNLAASYARRAADVYHKVKDAHYEVIALSNLSGYLLEKEERDYIESKKALDRCRLLLDSIIFPAGELNYYKHLAYYSFYVEKYEEAIVAVDSSLLYIQIFEDQLSRAQVNQLLYNIYKSKSDYKKSLEYYEKYSAINDSLEVVQNKKRLLDMDHKYETEKKEKEIANQDLEISQKTAQRNLALGGGLGLLALGGFIFYRNQKNEKLAKTKIENLEKQQRLMALDYMVQGQEDERKRIAQDLHDGLGGLLSTVRMKIKSISDQVDELSSINLVGETEKLVTEACDEVRRISHDMMPASLVRLSLKDALVDLIEEVRENHNLKINLNYEGEEAEIEENLRVQLYRIIQEILQNAIKHAGANTLNINMNVGDVIIVKTKDDGRGFRNTTSEKNTGIGLRNIESRVKYIGGTLDLKTEPGQGVLYTIVVPN